MEKYKSEVDVWNNIHNKVKEYENMQDCAEGVSNLCKLLDNMHPSDAYMVFRDYITPFKKNRIISECKRDHIEVYQQLQNLKLEAIKSHEHDNKCPTNLEVDKVVSKAYGITLRMLRTHMDMETAQLNKIIQAINKIEEKLELDITDFKDGEDSDTKQFNDEQRNEEITK